MRGGLVLASSVMALLSPARGAVGDDDQPIVAGEVGAFIDRYLSGAEPFGIHAQVLVRYDGEIVLSKGYGLADRDAEAPITPQTILDVGSIAKQFTATAILKLQSQGKLNVEDPIGAYLPDITPPHSDIRIHELLTHTSGLGTPDLRGVDMTDRDAFLKSVLFGELRAAPGEQFMYSNLGYGVLAALVEVASGQRFEDYVRAELFEPAGLTTTGFGGESTFERPLVARSYTETEVFGSALDWPYNWGFRGATGVLTTAADLDRWMEAVLGGTILPEPELTALITPTEHGYACGWHVYPFVGQRVLRHGGTTQGFDCVLYDLNADDPGRDYRIILLCNTRGHTGSIEGAIVAMLSGVPVNMPPVDGELSEAQEARLIGTYRLESGGRIEVTHRGEHLQLGAMGQDAVNALFSPLFGMDDQYELARTKTREVLLGLMDGRFDVIRTVMGPGKPAAWPMQLAAQIHGKANELGEFEGVETVGVAVQPNGAFRVAARLTGSEGATVVCLDWFGETLDAVRLEEHYAARALVVMGSPETGAHFSVPTGERIEISFDLPDEGPARSLTIQYLGTKHTLMRE